MTEQNKQPVLALRDMVVFPNMVVPLFIGRERSILALDAVMSNTKEIILLAQKEADLDDPNVDDLYHFGVVAKIIQLMKLPDGTVKALIEGLRRVDVKNLEITNDMFLASVEEQEDMDDIAPDDEKQLLERDAMIRMVIKKFDSYSKLSRKIPPEISKSLAKIKDVKKLTDILSSHLDVKVSVKQEILEELNLTKRLALILSAMENEAGLAKMEKKIGTRVKRQMEKTQKDYYLNEKMKAIKKELGDDDASEESEIKEIEKKIKKTKLSKEAKEKITVELKKLKSTSPMSSEAGVIRTYIDTILALPWKKPSKLNKDLTKAQGILDEDHYGLEKVKERIVEYLAVQQRMKKVKGPILCFVGPPGVGKTSLGSSIAKATSREFVRVALGGVSDESEIRGHRRTYVGAMPGKVINAMKKSKVSNPLILFDEIDKISSNWRGDPAAALLEVLDPEQNDKFVDHYMELEYDLSDVMFICTANSLEIPDALLDRMEVINLSGYTEEEKQEIAKRHIIKKQQELAGLKDNEWQVDDESLLDLIRYYTREAGVRNLEREINKLTRKAVKEILIEDDVDSIAVSSDNLEKYLGVRKYKFGLAEESDQHGVVTGLAYTQAGGDVLSIEALLMYGGKGNAKITGKLGDVMQESIKTAFSFVRSNSLDFGIKPMMFKNRDIHIHVPEGAVPKDGPSAGVGMVTTIVSAFTGVKVKKDVAMTGEVTLRGNVLPIGGLKEKTMAAVRAGIKTVIIPHDNLKDLKDIPETITSKLEIIPAKHVTEVLKHALVEELVPLNWSEEEIEASFLPVKEEGEVNKNLAN